MHISELHYLRLYLKNSWSRFAKNCPVGIFCEIMKSNLVDDDDFTSFYQVLEGWFSRLKNTMDEYLSHPFGLSQPSNY